jgi:hypothetical protein
MPVVLTSNFQRLPYNHGDLNSYHDAVMRTILAGGIGGLSIEATNVGSAITVSRGFAGIYDGTLAGKGAIEVTVSGNITTAGASANLWHALEFSVSGTSVTWYLTPLAGETDESFMSLTMKNYYDGSKNGYYRIASRRIIAFVFLRTALAVGRIVNCESGKLGFKNIEIVNCYDNAKNWISYKYYAKIESQIGAWNMYMAGGGSASKSCFIGFLGKTLLRIKSMKVIVFDDNFGTGNIYFIDTATTSGGIAGVPAGGLGVIWTPSSPLIALYSLAGGIFNTVAFQNAVLNRGFIFTIFET